MDPECRDEDIVEAAPSPLTSTPNADVSGPRFIHVSNNDNARTMFMVLTS